MPPANQDRRRDVLDAAKEHGWTSDSDRTRHGAISDQFTKGARTLTCFWSETPWSDARWDGGVLSSPDGQREVWRIERDDGVLDILKT
jgi:hypothetical protein